MNLPFTPEQFIQIFTLYNTSVWPMQILFNLLAFAAICLAFKSTPVSGIVNGVILGFFWIWMGGVYHLKFFSAINPAAISFSIFFGIQGILFIQAGLGKKLTPACKPDLKTAAGSVIIVYGIIVYPMLSAFLGHGYPNGPTFGVPCPTTVFTFGILLLTANPPGHLFVIPALWSVIALSAAFSLDIYEDFGLPAACILALCLTFQPVLNKPGIAGRIKTWKAP